MTEPMEFAKASRTEAVRAIEITLSLSTNVFSIVELPKVIKWFNFFLQIAIKNKVNILFVVFKMTIIFH